MSATQRQIGQTFLDLQITGILGRGAMGEVYEARRGDTVFALKIPRISGPEATLRFEREASALRKFSSHPNILKVYQYGLQPTPFILSERLSGRTLADLINSGEKPDLSQLCEWAEMIASALDSLHAAGLVHRDIKPANIFLDNGRVIVGDLGLVRDLQAETLTQTGAFVGTPLTAAPEQWTNNPGALTPAIDIWALGVTLLWLFDAKPPFTGETHVELARAIQSTNPQFPREFAQEPELFSLVQRALSRNPTERPRAEDFTTLLSQRQRNQAIHSIRQRKMKFLAVFVALTLLMTAAMIYALSSRINPKVVLDEPPRQELHDFEEYLLLREFDPEAQRPPTGNLTPWLKQFIEKSNLIGASRSEQSDHLRFLLRALETSSAAEIPDSEFPQSKLFTFLRTTRKRSAAPPPFLKAHEALCSALLFLARGGEAEAVNQLSSLKLTNPFNQEALSRILFHSLTRAFCQSLLDHATSFEQQSSWLQSIRTFNCSDSQQQSWRRDLEAVCEHPLSAVQDRILPVLRNHHFSEPPGRFFSIPLPLLLNRFNICKAGLAEESPDPSPYLSLEFTRLAARLTEHKVDIDVTAQISGTSVNALLAAVSSGASSSGSREPALLRALWDCILALSRIGYFDRFFIPKLAGLDGSRFLSEINREAENYDPLENAITDIWLALVETKQLYRDRKPDARSAERLNAIYQNLSRGLSFEGLGQKILSEAFRMRAFIQTPLLLPENQSPQTSAFREALAANLKIPIDELRRRIQSDYLKSIELGCDEPDEVYLDLAEDLFGDLPDRRREYLDLAEQHIFARDAATKSDQGASPRYSPTNAVDTNARAMLLATFRAEVFIRGENNRVAAITQLNKAGDHLLAIGSETASAREQTPRVISLFNELQEPELALRWIETYAIYLYESERATLRQLVGKMR